MNKPVKWLLTHKTASWTLVLAYATAIYTLSSIPRASQSFGMPSTIAGFEHAIEYAGLGFLLAIACASSNINGVLPPLIISILYGASDEIHQLYVPGRYAETGDVITDAIGSLAGVVIAVRMMPYKRQSI